MNAMLWKDLYSIRSTIVIMILVAFAFSLMIGEGGPLSFYIGSAMASTVVGTSMNLDDRSGWMKFAISSGVDRRSIVRNKMVLAIFVCLVGVASGFLAMGVMCINNPVSYSAVELVTMMFFGFSFGLFCSAVMIVSCYRFSPSHSGLFAAITIGGSVGFFVGMTGVLSEMMDNMLWVFAIIGLVFICLSTVFYVLGEALFVRKDF